MTPLVYVVGAVALAGGSVLVGWALWRMDRREDLGTVSPGWRWRNREEEGR